MATDRFVYWNDRRPNKEELLHAITDYLGDGIGCVKWEEKQSRWYVTLNGASSHPLKHIAPKVHLIEEEERWFEIVWSDDELDIITRSQDPITSSIATGFYNFCLSYWQARTS